jgi:hypothetical protein
MRERRCYMAVTQEVLELGRRKINEFIDGCLELIEAGEADAMVDRSAADGPARIYEARRESWTLSDETFTIEWMLVGEEPGVTYKWPDGNVDEYDRFVTYRGTSDEGLFTLALGYLANGDVVGFVLGVGGGSERGITYFFPADDFETTQEKVSMIRGGGQTGRSGFEPGEALPRAYDGFKTDVLRDRVAGKWSRQAVVAKEDDFETMLNHTAIQARLRGLA